MLRNATIIVNFNVVDELDSHSPVFGVVADSLDCAKTDRLHLHGFTPVLEDVCESPDSNMGVPFSYLIEAAIKMTAVPNPYANRVGLGCPSQLRPLSLSGESARLIIGGLYGSNPKRGPHFASQRNPGIALLVAGWPLLVILLMTLAAWQCGLFYFCCALLYLLLPGVKAGIFFKAAS